MEKRNRKQVRLAEYDYSNDGSYFITICSKEHRCIFSHIVGDGVLDVPLCRLTDYGKLAEKTLLEVTRHYENVTLDSYVIMPNHIHLLLTFRGTSRTPSPTTCGRASASVPSFISTWKRFANKAAGADLFQRSYYDHIIRDEMDFVTRLRYIEENPLRWQKDELYRD